MEKKSKSYKRVIRIEKKLKSWNKLYDSLNEIVLEAKQDIAPRSSLPISIPFNIFQPKKIADKNTQTDITFLEKIIVDTDTLTKNNQKELSEQVDDNIAEMNPNLVPLTPIVGTIYEAITPDVCVPPRLTQNDNKITIAMHPPKSTNVNKTSNVTIISNERISPSEKMSNKIINPEVINNDIQKTIDQNDLSSDTEMTRTITDNNVLKDIYHTSQNYKTFVNKIFLTIGKLFKAGTIGNSTEKLGKVSDIFDNIVNLFISENDSNVEKRDQETNTDSRPKPIDIQVSTKTNAEIDLQLQSIKQERKDDEENEECAAELPEMITRPDKEPTPEKQIEIPRTEAVAQPKKPQPPTETSNNYSYEHYHNLYRAQNQPKANTNGSILAQNTRPPCPPPAPVQNIPPTLPYSNQSYYANQESVNKSHRYPCKRPYSGQSTPYQRYPQQVPNQQPPHNQQSFYPQYLHQQNLQMQGQMFSQNGPYH